MENKLASVKRKDNLHYISEKSFVHIANILGYLSQKYGGPPRVALDMGSTMTKHGVRVSFWASGDASDRRELEMYKSSVHLYDSCRPRGWYRIPQLIRDLSMNIPDIDLFHLHEVWSYPQYASARLSRRKGIPYVLTPHGVLEPWRIRSKACKKYVYLTLLGKNMLNKAACLHAVTPLEAEGIRKIGYKGPITVVPNGVDPNDFVNMPCPSEAEKKWPQLSGRRVVLFLSRISREKGLEQLLCAWNNLMNKSSYDDTILVIAGPDYRGYLPEVEAMIEQFNLEANTILTGLVQGQEKSALISRADIYTLPSYSEGFSMSLLENLAASKPVLITPGCNFPEVAEVGAGLCVSPESYLLEQALAELLDMSDSERRFMGQRGRELVEKNYTWEVAARKMITVYQCILDDRIIPMYPEPVNT